MIHVAPTSVESNLAIAQAICTVATQAIREQGRFTWVLSGGSTPKALFELLVTSQWRNRLEWPLVEFFWGDERPVARDHPDSNFRMAREVLLDPLRIDASRIHRMQGDHPDLDAAATAYEDEITAVLGTGSENSPVPFDLVLLGLGDDGHTASLFPHSPALKVPGRAVVANAVPQLQTCRLTMTAARLNCAKAIFFLVQGPNKAHAAATILQGPRDPPRYPAQLISASAEWFLDEAAAQNLDSE